MHVHKIFVLIMGMVIIGKTTAIAQIPANGSDFPTLVGLHWGMTMKEARDCIGERKI